MAIDQFTNEFTTTLNGAIDNSTQSLTLTSATGSGINAAPSAPFRIRIEDEIILVGARSGTSCTSCTRGADGTSAASHADTTAIRHILTRRSLEQLADPRTCTGRLTLETGVAVSTSDQTAKTTVYFTPYFGARVSLHDGTGWTLYTFSELSLALGSITSAKNYDIWLYNNSGTLTLQLSSAWTSDSARADAITTQDGIYVKSGDTTRRYLGTIRTTSTTTTEDSLAKRYVWNANVENRVERPLYLLEGTSHTYTSTTYRYWQNSSANIVSFVVGIIDKPVFLNGSFGSFASSASVGATNALSLNWTSGTPSATTSVVTQVNGGNFILRGCSAWKHPSLGYNYIAALEQSSAATSTFSNVTINSLVLA